MADTFTAVLNLTKPEVGASTDTWGAKLNVDLDALDALFDAGPALKLSKGGTGAATAAGARTNLGAQETLVSGTNIKTVNSTSLLGPGNIEISVPAAFPAGTVMLFAQTAAPTGWTKSTAHDNKALRVVSGTAGSGGSAAFTTALGAPGVSGSVSLSGSVGATTLSTAQMPSHSHQVRNYNGEGGFAAGVSLSDASWSSARTQTEGGGGSHTHSFSGSGSLSGASAAINVAYVDVIIATKN